MLRCIPVAVSVNVRPHSQTGSFVQSSRPGHHALPSCCESIGFTSKCQVPFRTHKPSQRSRQLSPVLATASGNTASSPPAGPPGVGARKTISNNKKVNNVPILGTITQNLSNGKFRVKLVNGVTVIAHLSGKIRKNKIKIAVGDEVTVELSAYDLTRGRISRRH